MRKLRCGGGGRGSGGQLAPPPKSAPQPHQRAAVPSLAASWNLCCLKPNRSRLSRRGSQRGACLWLMRSGCQWRRWREWQGQHRVALPGPVIKLALSRVLDARCSHCLLLTVFGFEIGELQLWRHRALGNTALLSAASLKTAELGCSFLLQL